MMAPMNKQPYTVVATKGEFEICHYAGSMGYQVFRSGKFYTFSPTLADAQAWLK